MNPFLNKLFKSSILGVLIVGGLVLPVRCEDSPNSKDKNGKTYSFSQSPIKILAGKLLLDSQVEVTQVLQADKYINFVNVSTPTLTPATGHSLLFANSGAKQFIAKYSDGSTQVLGGGGSSGAGTITGVTAGTDLTGGGTTGTVTLNVDTSLVLETSSATATYLQKSSATATYLQQVPAANTYITLSSAAATYLQQVPAANTYLTQSSATVTYLYASSGPVTYLMLSSATATYLTQSSATATYLQLSSAAVSYCHADGKNCTASAGASLSANQTFTGFNAFSSSVAIKGTTSNDNAIAGNVGEVLLSSVPRSGAVSLGGSSGSSVNVLSIVLTAGDWDVYCLTALTAGSGTFSAATTSLSTTSNTLSGSDTIAAPDSTGQVRGQLSIVSGTYSEYALPFLHSRVSISGSTTYYLVVNITFAVATPSAFGSILARRIH